MPILKYFELDEDRDDKRAAMITPRYVMDLSQWLCKYAEQELHPEDEMVALILCGLSAVSYHSICRYDIKLTNIMIEKIRPHRLWFRDFSFLFYTGYCFGHSILLFVLT